MELKHLNIAISLLLMVLVSSCSTVKYVGEDRSLLDGNKIEFKDKENISNQNALRVELNSFITQEPNNSLFWLFPREWFYFKNSDPGDTSWFNNWVRDGLGENPVFYNRQISEETATTMQQYLRNKKGYYNANVNFETTRKEHKTKVNYNIKTGRRYRIKSINYIGDDPEVVEILKEISLESRINVGDPLDAAIFDLEKSRMVNALQNKGYANFLPNYLDIKGDSTNGDFGVDVFFEVYAPLPDTLHKQYTVGDINIYTDFYSTQDSSVLKKYSDSGINYYRQSKDFIVRPSLLRSKIFIDKDQLYSRSKRTKSFRKLSDLGTYRFVQMEPRINPEQDSIINYDIFLTPHQHAWVSDVGLEINYSSVASQTQRQLFGLSANGVLTNRNLLGGAEQNTLSVTNGYELNLDSLSLSTFSIGVNNNLITPKHIDFLGVTKGLNSLGILSDNWYSNFKTETVTSFNLGYNLIDILDFYTINSINASVSYDYQPSQTKRFVIRQTAFSLSSYDLEQRFLDDFGNNQLIIKSFEDNLSTGYLFNEISFYYNSIPKRNGFSYSLLGSFETSGWETHLFNELYNAFASEDKVWSFSEDIAFAKYIRTEIDTRIYKKINNKQSLAFRFNAGLAFPFGEQEVVPFIKQFSVGGPISMRAWDQKELGPGSYVESNQPANQIFFQQGDVKLEINAEYRFDVAWLLEGALFTDIGNVWTLDIDEMRPGSNFTSSFYKQLAIGAGWGMRWDFTYFNIRFDFGYRIRNPFPDENGSYWYSWKEIRDQGFGNLQVAVNYPF